MAGALKKNNFHKGIIESKPILYFFIFQIISNISGESGSGKSNILNLILNTPGTKFNKKTIFFVYVSLQIFLSVKPEKKVNVIIL